MPVVLSGKQPLSGGRGWRPLPSAGCSDVGRQEAPYPTPTAPPSQGLLSGSGLALLNKGDFNLHSLGPGFQGTTKRGRTGLA